MADTTIEWTDVVWNPTTGCDKVSPGCDHCYALTMAKRLKGMGQAKYQTDGDPRTSGPGFGLAMHPDALDAPLSWRKPRKVFVNSMSDLFHPKVTDEFIAQVFAVMALTPQHTYQVLTKRPKRMRALLNDEGFRTTVAHIAMVRTEASSGPPYMPEHLVIPPEGRSWWPLTNVWIGTSVEDQHRADERIPALLDTPAAVRFISAEPLLGPVDLGVWTWPHKHGVVGEGWTDRDPLDWVIVGGESGNGARLMDPDWVRSLRDQCTDPGVAFFFKQWGGIRPKAGGRELDGRTWDEMPSAVTA